MATEYQLRSYDNEERIWLIHSCGFEANLGFEPTLEFADEVKVAHEKDCDE